MASDSVLLVLAHSRKHQPGVCVAGRAVRMEADPSRYRFGPWVRPVTSHAEGELLPDECRLTCGRPPRPLDFITVPLGKPLNDPAQPENWSIRPRVPWREANDRFRPPMLDRLIETPEDLWNQKGERRDRVSADYVRKHPPPQSLYLIRVENLRVRYDWHEPDGFPKERRRALFSYRGVEYDWSLTDLAFHEKHQARFPRWRQPAQVIPIAGPGIVCVSLGREFQGYHYKLVATIFEDATRPS